MLLALLPPGTYFMAHHKYVFSRGSDGESVVALNHSVSLTDRGFFSINSNTASISAPQRLEDLHSWILFVTKTNGSPLPCEKSRFHFEIKHPQKLALSIFDNTMCCHFCNLKQRENRKAI